jgi:TetR/AcrR family transcriptional repressor of bet genes
MRPSNTQQRRQQIIEALVIVMAQKGYEKASIADVAQQAGLTQGLIHYHFNNKQEILLAVLEDLINQHKVRLEEKLEGKKDPLSQLETFIDFHLKLDNSADPNMLNCWIMLSGEALRQEKVRESYQQAVNSIVERLKSILKQGVVEKVFSCQEDIVASAIMAAIQGYFVLAATAPMLIPKGSAASSVRKMALALVR